MGLMRIFLPSQADNIMNILNDKLQPGYLTNSDDFIAQLAKDAKFKPFGNLVHSYTVSKGKHHLSGFPLDLENLEK